MLAVLNQILPKNLNTLTFCYKVFFSDNSLGTLESNWKRSKPFTIKLPRYEEHVKSEDLFIKYEDLGFLNYCYH